MFWRFLMWMPNVAAMASSIPTNAIYDRSASPIQDRSASIIVTR